MKKYIISFIVFIVVFFAAIGFIYYQANPATRLSDDQNLLEWHGQVENEFGTYKGSLIGELFSGTGDFSFLSGEFYSGDWEDSHMSGNGKIVFPEIGEYTGEMSGSQRNGTGTFTWYSGEKYEGSWENDTMSGNGKYTFANGSILEGVFKDNKPVSGKYSYKNDTSESVSESDIVSLVYSFSESDKQIVFSTKGGLKYDGDFSGLFGSGEATVTYPSGNTYTGQLSNGKREGSGKYTWKNNSGETNAYYDGNWKADHMNGSGEYHYSASSYPYLSGAFENDAPSGTLTYYKEAGNTFETKWENGNCTSIKET